MEKFEKPFIIPVFIPNQGCPHQCVFCNQSSIAGAKWSIPSHEQIASLINEHLEFKGEKRHKAEIAFFGGNFLGLKDDVVQDLLSCALEFVLAGKIDSIRFSTRPDTISNNRLNAIEKYPVLTIEIGAQSMDDTVLKKSNRGHTAKDTSNALNLLKERKYKTGIQMMAGLPGDDDAKLTDTTYKIINLHPDFVRIYPTIVLADSPLGVLYKNKKYQPLSLEQSVSLVKKIYLLFNKNNIPVIRMGLQPTEELNYGDTILAGPYHPAFGHLVYSEIFLDGIINFFESNARLPDKLVIYANPVDISKIRGIKNSNIRIISERFNPASIKIKPNNSLSQNTIIVNDAKIKIL
jgi:histone acetyltransferase (RNA polymerase elongator complex component)